MSLQDTLRHLVRQIRHLPLVLPLALLVVAAAGCGGGGEEVLDRLAPYCSGFLCTYVDKEGMLQGTDLEWFRSLRAATPLELTAAGGITTLAEIEALQDMHVHAALGMAIYTGRLDLTELARLNLRSTG